MLMPLLHNDNVKILLATKESRTTDYISKDTEAVTCLLGGNVYQQWGEKTIGNLECVIYTNMSKSNRDNILAIQVAVEQLQAIMA